MIIRMGMVIHENITKVEELIEVLEPSVVAGEMEIADKALTALIGFIEEDTKVDLDEVTWKKLNEIIRNSNKNYTSNYVIKGEIIELINTEKISALNSMLIKIAVKSLECNGIILQIPLDERMHNVK